MMKRRDAVKRRTYNLNSSKQNQRGIRNNGSLRNTYNRPLQFLMGVLFICLLNVFGFFSTNSNSNTTPQENLIELQASFPSGFTYKAIRGDLNANAETRPHPLPQWIRDYMSWHRKMRSQFPGESIITDPNAPPVLVRTCLVSKKTDF